MCKKIEGIKDLQREKARLRAELQYREAMCKIRYDRVATVVEKPELILTMASTSQNVKIKKTANVIIGLIRIISVTNRIIRKFKERKKSSEQK